jgi:polysaccharide export outer membrane protein
MSNLIVRVLAVYALLALPLVAMAQAQKSSTPAAGPPEASIAPAAVKPANNQSEYVLGPEDVIEFGVVGTNDKARARIYTDGTIQTNLGGRLPAAGRTPKQLAEEIGKTLKDGGFYASPVVNVEIVSFASRYVTVLGQFGAPGLVPIDRSYHLSEIMARVGGVRPDAADYIVVRSETGPEKRYSVKALSSGDPDQDPLVNAGEKIFSPVAELFYLSGQVKAPGPYPLRSGMTIAQAIAAGGGLTDSGSDRKIKVRRGSKQITLQGDAKVEPGDVLTIGERLF